MKIDEVSIDTLRKELNPYLRVNKTFANNYSGGHTERDFNFPIIRLGQLGKIILECLRGPQLSFTIDATDHETGLREELCHLLGIKDSSVNNERLNAFLLAHTKLIVTKSANELLIFNYDDGVYEPAENTLGRILAHLLNYAGGNVWSRSMETSVLGLLERKARVVDDDKLDAKFYAFKDSALDLDTLKLVPFSPDQLTTKKSPVNPVDIDTPIFDQFMQSTFDDDVTREFVISWVGYQIDREVAGETFLFMVSSGAGGKSSLINIIRQIVGPRNCTSERLQSLGSQFGRQPLLGKTSLLADESSEEDFPFDIVKALTTGAPMTVDIKNKPQVEVKLPIKLTFAVNTLPPAEATIGFSRRLLVLPFKHVFLGNTANKELPQQLLSEAGGVAFKAIKALQSLRNNSYRFVESPVMKLAKEEYLNKGRSQAMRFLLDRMQQSPGNRIRRSDIYKVFTDWCRQEDTTEPLRAFWKDAQQYWQSALNVSYSKVMVNGYDFVLDVAWKEEGEDDHHLGKPSGSESKGKSGQSEQPQAHDDSHNG
ncbi:DNA primase family protein [Levilactobacillus acidifarinae]|uniref:p4 family phage plasmid primase n=1 Tax=Levilactobacillus acidifarinae DSM 19394 = JCM 15949 TaxID=1423715 RepID=A0A0R1LH11_9LACO|nr:phage/plasmid primase, P4 family [Levilactobacillus acidifarinae]KRK95007.1 P4 family phage plasmid primase [Levilactobacillus acidifarinae DSM 19394]GEO70769.1 hypothetical protein LAC03_26790 [Levilactobacillus acidifarinae]